MKWLDSLGKRLFACMLIPLLASCAHLDAEHPMHPLIGKVWDVSAQRFVDPARVIERATEARFVLLGEIHDNAEHHRIQARILDAMVQRGRKPALVMEQYDVEQQSRLNTLVQSAGANSDKLRGLRELMRTSWDFGQYQPMVSRALNDKLPLIAANLSRESLRSVAREGYQELGTGEEERLEITSVWSEDKEKQLVDEVSRGHCGKISEHVIQAVTKSQRARDAVMADKLLMTRRSGAVAIVGRNHARQDLGVPIYLEARAPHLDTVSIGLVEVNQPTDPMRYAYSPLGQMHDYLWFTPHPIRKSNACDSIPAQTKEG